MENSIEEKNAYVLRITLGGKSRIYEALDKKEIMIGWSTCPGLMNPKLSRDELRELLKTEFHSEDTDYKAAGQDAGEMQRFRDMKIGDLIVVPQPREFYIAEIAGGPYYDKEKVEEDTSYRRPVKWLNKAKPIPRRIAKAFLQSRMKYQRTCVDATDLLEEILDALRHGSDEKAPSFEQDLRARLIKETQNEICSGRINDRLFEELVAAVLVSLGVSDARIIGRSVDRGADIIATFPIAHAFKLKVAVQAKHYVPKKGSVPAEKLDELVRGMEAEDVDLGMFVTSGVFSDEFLNRAAKLKIEKGMAIEVVDGEQLATMIVEGGLHLELKH
jgi:predicted Mrr-cat superfamily restriction endonuclease